MSNLLPLYLRREPSTDPILRDHFTAHERMKKADVVAYSDPRACKVKARWMWHQPSRPTRRNKRVTLNCYQWEVIWLPALD